MDLSSFDEKTHGRIVHTAQGYYAYVPDSLEPDISLDLELVAILSEADRGLSELAGVARTLPNPHLLIGINSIY